MTRAVDGPEDTDASLSDHPPEERPEALDPERSAAESARRAKITLRRHGAAHGLDRLGTLTYRCRRCTVPFGSGCICPEGPDRPRHDELDVVLGDIAQLRRRIRALLGPIPLAIVVEHHKDGHLHVHFGYSQFLDKAVVQRCWDHGFVDLRRMKLRDGERLGARERARRCAAYLAKYVTKEAGQGAGRWRKSYSTTRGITAPPRRARFMSEADARRWLEAQTGLTPSREWSSAEVDDWEPPPCWLLFYDDPPP